MKLSNVLVLGLFVVSTHAFAERGGGNKPICTGNEPPRKGAAYISKPSADDLLADYLTALAQYEIDHPEAAEYAQASKEVSSRSCFQDSDCSVGDGSKFIGGCLRYEWEGTNGSCYLTPRVAIPQPPALVLLTCEDVLCPSNFKCEVEENNGAVGCVENRTCRDPR